MAHEVSIYDPRTMGKLIRQIPPVRTFIRSTFFRNEQTFVTEKVDVDFVKGSRKIAPYVHRMIGGKAVKNEGYETKTYTPPLVSPYKVTTAEDLMTRLPGENPYSGKSPAQRAVEKLGADMIELRDMIARREELMCAQALFTGTIPVIGDGVSELIDFGFTNTETIKDASKKWSNADADPLADLRRWHRQVQKTGFTNCNMCIMANDVADAFIANKKVQEVLDIKNYLLAVIQPTQLPNGATYIGTIHEMGLDIYTYNEWYLDDWTNPEKPEEKPLVPDGTLAMVSSNSQFSMYYGAITTIDAAGKDFMTVEGKYVPETYTKRRPARKILQVSSAPLPVPHEVDSWFTAKVL